MDGLFEDHIDLMLIENKRLKAENNRLKEENKRLRRQINNLAPTIGLFDPTEAITQKSDTNKNSAPDQKIALFLSLFQGRADVFAKRWENLNKGISGYIPVCANEWHLGICIKPKEKCSSCPNKEYIKYSEKTVNDHLSGKMIVGIYPLLPDDSCHFLVIDFDKSNWKKDVPAISWVCESYDLSYSVERSRSGNGAHIWFFFNEPLPAKIARKLGSALLTTVMTNYYQLGFDSYDRFFPNQDTLPTGGFGNLIALPLQKQAVDYGMVIVDECHHVSAFSFEKVVKATNAKYLYGLSATPKRQDGHQPILFMRCGTIRYQVDALDQANKRPFDHIVSPRFTPFKMPKKGNDEKIPIQEIYAAITCHEARNNLIIRDVLEAYAEGRNSIILADRIDHVKDLANRLRDKIDPVIVLSGGMNKKLRHTYWEPFYKDLTEAYDQILIVSPHLAKHKIELMTKTLSSIVTKGLKVVVKTRETDESILTILTKAGFEVQTQHDLVQQYSIWYGSIQILGNNGSEESIMRLQNRDLVLEILSQQELK